MKFVFTKIPIYNCSFLERLKLLFVKPQISIDYGMNPNEPAAFIKYKVLKDKIYVIEDGVISNEKKN